jgi:phosphomannomutase
MPMKWRKLGLITAVSGGLGFNMMLADKLDPTILREYDIRGIVDDTLTEDAVTAIGRAFGTVVRRGGGRSVAVGYDGRISSPHLETALSNGLKMAGVNVVQVGLGPTPMLYYAAHTLDVDAGAMITGSHNPPEYNGIKMVIQGKSFYGDAIQDLGRIVAEGNYETGDGEVSTKIVFDDYVQRVMDDFKAATDLRVAWDPGNGSAGDVVAEVCRRLPGEHFLINQKIDGTFPAHHPDPTVEKNLEQLKTLVAAQNCDIGLAFDGDGDRIGVIDGQGRVMWGDQLMVVLAGEILSRKPGSVIIADVKASQVFFDEIERMGGKPVMWKTGHSLIKSKMQETGAPLAGEMSAHIFFSDGYYGYDDAVYAAIRLLSIIGTGDESLSDIMDRLPQMLNTPELRFDCDEARKFQVVEEVAERLKTVEGITVHDIDGVRVQSDDGWWLLRASNTQAVLVARCESTTEEGLKRLKSTLTDQLIASGLEAPDFT